MIVKKPSSTSSKNTSFSHPPDINSRTRPNKTKQPMINKAYSAVKPDKMALT